MESPVGLEADAAAADETPTPSAAPSSAHLDRICLRLPTPRIRSFSARSNTSFENALHLLTRKSISSFAPRPLVRTVVFPPRPCKIVSSGGAQNWTDGAGAAFAALFAPVRRAPSRPQAKSQCVPQRNIIRRRDARRHEKHRGSAQSSSALCSLDSKPERQRRGPVTDDSLQRENASRALRGQQHDGSCAEAFANSQQARPECPYACP